MTKNSLFIAVWLAIVVVAAPAVAQNPAWFSSIRLGTGGDDELVIRLVDDSDYAPVISLYQRVGSGSPEGAVTAPVGSIYHRTDGGSGTSLYIKQSGSGNTGWAAVTP